MTTSGGSSASRFFPVFSPYWQGETCCMCNGTGRDASYITEPEADGIERVVGRAENGLPCRACNGHGREPS